MAHARSTGSRHRRSGTHRPGRVLSRGDGTRREARLRDHGRRPRATVEQSPTWVTCDRARRPTASYATPGARTRSTAVPVSERGEAGRPIRGCRSPPLHSDGRDNQQWSVAGPRVRSEHGWKWRNPSLRGEVVRLRRFAPPGNHVSSVRPRRRHWTAPRFASSALRRHIGAVSRSCRNGVALVSERDGHVSARGFRPAHRLGYLGGRGVPCRERRR